MRESKLEFGMWDVWPWRWSRRTLHWGSLPAVCPCPAPLPSRPPYHTCCPPGWSVHCPTSSSWSVWSYELKSISAIYIKHLRNKQFERFLLSFISQFEFAEHEHEMFWLNEFNSSTLSSEHLHFWDFFYILQLCYCILNTTFSSLRLLSLYCWWKEDFIWEDMNWSIFSMILSTAFLSKLSTIWSLIMKI